MRDGGRGGLRRHAYALVALMLIVVAACGTLGHVNEASDALRRSGHRVTSVGFFTNGGNEVRVAWLPRGETAEEVADEGRDIVAIVWRTAKLRLDAIELWPAGHPGSSVPRAAIEQRLGPRDPALDAYGVDFGVPGWLLAAVLGGGAAAIGLIVWLVRRSRRRDDPPPGPWAPGSWAQQPWPQGPAPPWGPSPSDPFASPPG